MRKCCVVRIVCSVMTTCDVAAGCDIGHQKKRASSDSPHLHISYDDEKTKTADGGDHRQQCCWQYLHHRHHHVGHHACDEDAILHHYHVIPCCSLFALQVSRHLRWCHHHKKNHPHQIRRDAFEENRCCYYDCWTFCVSLAVDGDLAAEIEIRYLPRLLRCDHRHHHRFRAQEGLQGL